MANPLSLLPFIISLIQRAWKLDTRLQAFYKRFEAQHPGPLYWARLSNGFNRSIQGEGGEAVFPVAFQFESMGAARTCTVYWATLAMHWSGMRFIYSLLGSLAPLPCLPTPDTLFPSPITGLPPLGHRADPTTVAKNICQSVEYMVQQSPEVGAMIAVFPLKVAIETLSDAKDIGCERELEWAKGVLERISGSGVRILECLKGEEVEKHSFIPGPDKADALQWLH
jgi:hypothetical protein